MTRSFLALIVLASIVLIWSCDLETNPPIGDPDPAQDAGEEEADAGDGAADAGDAGEPPPPRPKDIVFALGMTDNSGSVPQGAPFIKLTFDQAATPNSETVVAHKVSLPMTLDGTDFDWSEVRPSVIPLETRGNPIGMNLDQWNLEWGLLGSTVPVFDFGLSNAIVRAAYDDQNLYFLVEWSDATQNNARDLLSFDGVWTKGTENEDRLYFAFNIAGTFEGFEQVGCAAACHLKERLGDVTSAGKTYRTRMHTNAAGELADVWSWRATTTNPMGYADDLYWDESSRKSDGVLEFAISNRPTDGGSTPLYMSEQGVNANPTAIYAPDSGLSPMAVPYDGSALDAGARLPGYVYQRASPGRDDVRAVGKWKNGKWTVELSRALETTDPKDAQFPIQ